MNRTQGGRRWWAAWWIGLACLAGCPSPQPDQGGGAGQRPPAGEQPAAAGEAAPEDVRAAVHLLDSLGAGASYRRAADGRLTEIVIPDGAVLSPEAIGLFGKLTDLEKLHIYNCRFLDDELAAQLKGLKNLKSLALTNSVISDATVEMIVASFPRLTELDLSSNTNMSAGALQTICRLTGLERLIVMQDGFNDIGTSHLAKLTNLRVLDLRGNMEAGDMTMEVVGGLPKLEAFKHRSVTVTDFGMEQLARSQTLRSLLMQDFMVTGQSGQHLAALPSLTELEVFRCQGFDSEGVLALRGKPLTRLTLRDLPMVDDRAMEVFTDLPQLKRLYLHELGSVSDAGLAHLAKLQSLELLDIWAVPQMTDAAVEAIAQLPNLTTLSIRSTGVTDAAIDTLLGMSRLRSLTLKDNGGVTADGLKRLTSREWERLDIDLGRSEGS